MADVKDVRALKIARTELVKRGINIEKCDLRILHGTLYLKGMISRAKGNTVKDLRAEMEHIRLVLRQKQEIKEVVLDCIVNG